jgi:hypothetical protein
MNPINSSEEDRPSGPWPTVDPFDDGIRPAGATDACFYCCQKVGEPHRRDCVVVKKTVRFRCTVDVDIEAPLSWTKKKIESSDSAHQQVWDTLFSSPGLFAPERIHNLHCECLGVVDDTPRRQLRNAN